MAISLSFPQVGNGNHNFLTYADCTLMLLPVDKKCVVMIILFLLKDKQSQSEKK